MNKRIPIFLGLIVLAFFIWVQFTPLLFVRNIFTRLENVAYDLQVRTKLFTHKTYIESPVVIVDIDDKSLEKEGHWPWPRAKLAQLIKQLQNDGAVVVAFDMLFPEKQSNIAQTVLEQLDKQSLKSAETNSLLTKIQPFFNDDAKFADSFKNIDITLGMTFVPSQKKVGDLPAPMLTLNTPSEKQLGFIIAPGYIANIPLLQNAAKSAGFLNVFPDPDGIVRRVPLLIRYQDGLYPSVALQAVQLYLLQQVQMITANYGDSLRVEGIKLGKHIIPTDPKAQVIIPFVGKSFTLPFISATNVLHNTISVDSLRGKIVFIGTSAVGLGDLHATSIQGIFPGVEIQASVAYGILHDSFSFKPAWSIGAEIFITVIIGLLCIFTFPYLGPRMLGLLILIIPPVLVMTNNWVWQKTGLIITVLIPITMPIVLAMINILYGYLFETLRREHLKEMFGQYVPEKHIDEMLSSGGKFEMKGDDREMTVLFADIRGFTAISEPLTATQLKELLNAFFTPMTEIIFKFRGTIDKYVGDMIMAFWGAPLRDKKHAQHALYAALEMQAAVKKLHAEFAAKNWPEINFGIGINTGEMSVGDMGSKFRRNYTVLGDAVNLASRIEELTKYYGVKIIVAENTKQNQTVFIFRQLDRVRVPGKKTAIAIYELVCRQSDASKELLQEITLSENALSHYFNQEWQKARDIFTELLQTHPNHLFYQLYLNRISEFETRPPAANWDGVYIHSIK